MQASSTIVLSWLKEDAHLVASFRHTAHFAPNYEIRNVRERDCLKQARILRKGIYARHMGTSQAHPLRVAVNPMKVVNWIVGNSR